jgi:hypothetical protein
LKVSKLEVKKTYLDTSFHLPSSQDSTASVRRASSSGFQNILLSCLSKLR